MDGFTLSWQVDLGGYEIIERGKKSRRLPGSGFYIKPKGGGLQTYDPLRIDGLYRKLAATKESPEAVLSFTNKFGLLLDVEPHDATQKFPLEVFYSSVRQMRDSVALADRKDWEGLTAKINKSDYLSRVNFGLRHQKGDALPEFQLIQTQLDRALMLQFIFDVLSGAKLRKCVWCPTWFKYGPGTGRRNTAIYCSPKCQKAHQYAKSKEAQR